MSYLSEIFKERPQQYGLRGDKYFWDYLENYFSKIEFPYSETGLTADVYRLFYELSGEKLRNDANPYVEQFAHGGMSSGMISGDFWIQEGIPLLVARYREMSNLACLSVNLSGELR